VHKTLTVVTDKEDSKLLCTSYSHMTGNVGNVSDRRAGLATYRNATISSPHCHVNVMPHMAMSVMSAKDVQD